MKKEEDVFHHIVFFHLKEGVTESQKLNAIEVLKNMGKNNTDIIKWVITESIDTRKGIIIIEDSIFKSEEAFQVFRKSEPHTNAVKVMLEISNWLIGDYFSEN